MTRQIVKVEFEVIAKTRYDAQLSIEAYLEKIDKQNNNIVGSRVMHVETRRD